MKDIVARSVGDYWKSVEEYFKGIDYALNIDVAKVRVRRQ